MGTNKLRRNILNKKRFRIKKALYMEDTETKKVAELEETVTFLRRKAKRMEEKQRLLKLENEALERLMEIRRYEASRLEVVMANQQAELRRLKEEEKEVVRMAMADQSN